MKARLYKYMYIAIAAASMCLGCLVALKIRTTTTELDNLLCLLWFSTLGTLHWSTKLNITKTYLYNVDPLKPHFYIVKLGFTGVYVIFLISAQKFRLCVPTIYVLSKNMKNIRIFIWKFSSFLVVKFSVYLNRLVFVMTTTTEWVRSGLAFKESGP